MKTSQQGLELIKRFEGFSEKPYLCPAKVWTIGYGSTHGISKNTPPVTKEQAEELLRRDLREFEHDINEAVKVPLTQGQFDALVSLVYNIGSGAFRKSTLLRQLNQGKYDKVPYELARWNKAGGKILPGITRRRAAEAALWSEDAEPVSGVTVQRDVPRIMTKENISMAAGIAGTAGMSQIAEGNGPIQYALAAVIVIGFAAGLFYFIRRRGA